MIDTHDQVLSSPAGRRRRSAPAPAPAAKRSVRPALPAKKSLPVQRVFSDANVKPFDQVQWEKRTAEITDDAGKVIFRQTDVEVPKSWSILATKVVVSKYFTANSTRPSAKLPSASSSTASAARSPIGASRTVTSPRPTAKFISMN